MSITGIGKSAQSLGVVFIKFVDFIKMLEYFYKMVYN